MESSSPLLSCIQISNSKFEFFWTPCCIPGLPRRRVSRNRDVSRNMDARDDATSDRGWVCGSGCVFGTCGFVRVGRGEGVWAEFLGFRQARDRISAVESATVATSMTFPRNETKRVTKRGEGLFGSVKWRRGDHTKNGMGAERNVAATSRDSTRRESKRVRAFGEVRTANLSHD